MKLTQVMHENQMFILQIESEDKVIVYVTLIRIVGDMSTFLLYQYCDGTW